MSAFRTRKIRKGIKELRKLVGKNNLVFVLRLLHNCCISARKFSGYKRFLRVKGNHGYGLVE
jgi:hypothetical protein